MYARQIGPGAGMSGSGNNYFYPVREFANDSMNKHINQQFQNPNLQEVLPQSFQSGNFNQGELNFLVDTSNNYGIIWGRSFFRISLTLNAVDNNGVQRQPRISDGIAFSQYVGGNLFQSASFAISSQTISQINNFVPQANAINNRLGYSGSFLYNNKDLLYSDPDFISRSNKISSDGINNLYNYTPINPAYMPLLAGVGEGVGVAGQPINPAYNTITLAVVAQPVAGANIAIALEIPATIIPKLKPVNLGIVEGSQITRFDQNNPMTVVSITANVNGTTYNIIATSTVPVTATDAAPIFTSSNNGGFLINSAFDISKAKTTQNTINVLYQPPLGVFSLSSDDALAGEFKVTLNPDPNFQVNAIQSLYPTLTSGTAAGGKYNVIVNSVRLYVYVVRTSFSPERSLKLRMMEMMILQKTLNVTTPSYEFTVPSSSRAFCVFMQSGLVTKNGSLNLGCSSFRSIDGKTAQLQNLQVTYGSISIPSTNYTTNENNTINFDASKSLTYAPALGSINTQQMRYWDYLISTGKLYSEGGAESYEDWINSPLYVYDFSNSQDSKATNVQIQVSFPEAIDNTAITPCNIYLVAFYSRVVSAQYKQNILIDMSVGNI